MPDFKYYFLVLVFLFPLLYSCKNDGIQKFNKDKWNEISDPAFPPPSRSKMLKDLTTNYKLVGMKRSQIIELMGDPDYIDSTSLSYKILIDYGSDIDPIYTKSLDFTFSNDSIISSFKVDEWKK